MKKSHLRIKTLLLALSFFFTAFYLTSDASALASTLTMKCPDTVEEKEFSCNLVGHSDSNITSINASFSMLKGVKLLSVEPLEDSTFSANTTSSSLTITSTEAFKGDFTIGEVLFEISPSTGSTSDKTEIEIELSLVTFNTGAEDSCTAIGSKAQLTGPYVEPTSSNTTQNNTTSTSNTTTPVENNTTTTTKDSLPSYILVMIIAMGVVIVAIIIILIASKKKKPVKPSPAPVMTSPAPAAPAKPNFEAAPPRPQPAPQQPTPTPVVNAPATQPKPAAPAGISVKNLPFENASSDKPMSFES